MREIPPRALFVDGAFIEARAHAPVRAPFDDAVVGEVGLADERELERALAAGARAEPVMAALPTDERRAILRRTALAIAREREPLAHLIAREAGKPIALARAEVERAETTFTLAHDALAVSRDLALPLDVVSAGRGRYGLARRFARGLALAITPFNFPLNLVAHKVAPALAAGCPVVVKPGDQAPLTALALAALVDEAGAPQGALQVVPTTRAHAALLTGDARPKVLSFTGSAAVGFALKARAPRMHTVLELGGDAAVVVMAGADLDDAASRVARGAFAYAGQVCISVQRVFVDERVRTQFEERLVAATHALSCGDPLDEAVTVGPLIDDGACARVASLVDEASAKGARALVSSQRQRRVFSPTILADVDDDTRLMREEAFGPVCTVASVSSIDEAIARVNASRFGLQCGVFTDSVRDLWRFFEGVVVGGVVHNDVPTFRVDHMPYGGEKDSGEGREGLPFSLDDYSVLRLLALRP